MGLNPWDENWTGSAGAGAGSADKPWEDDWSSQGSSASVADPPIEPWKQEWSAGGAAPAGKPWEQDWTAGGQRQTGAAGGVPGARPAAAPAAIVQDDNAVAGAGDVLSAAPGVWEKAAAVPAKAVRYAGGALGRALNLPGRLAVTVFGTKDVPAEGEERTAWEIGRQRVHDQQALWAWNDKPATVLDVKEAARTGRDVEVQRFADALTKHRERTEDWNAATKQRGKTGTFFQGIAGMLAPTVETMAFRPLGVAGQALAFSYWQRQGYGDFVNSGLERYGVDPAGLNVDQVKAIDRNAKVLSAVYAAVEFAEQALPGVPGGSLSKKMAAKVPKLANNILFKQALKIMNESGEEGVQKWIQEIFDARLAGILDKQLTKEQKSAAPTVKTAFWAGVQETARAVPSIAVGFGLPGLSMDAAGFLIKGPAVDPPAATEGPAPAAAAAGAGVPPALPLDLGEGFSVATTTKGDRIMTTPEGVEIALDPDVPADAAMLAELDLVAAPAEAVPVTIPAEPVGAEAVPAAAPTVAEPIPAAAGPAVLTENEAEVARVADRIGTDAAATVRSLNVKVRFVDSVDELPADIQEARRTRGALDAEGVYSAAEDASYVILGNVQDPAAVRTTILHEAVGHHGMRKVFGSNFDSILGGIVKSDRLQGELGKIAGQYGLDLDTADGRAEAADEFISRVAEGDYGASVWKKLVANVKLVLRSMGIEATFTENDVKALVRRAHKRLTDVRDAAALDEFRPLLPGARAALDLLQDAEDRIEGGEKFGRGAVRDADGNVIGWGGRTGAQRRKSLLRGIRNMERGKKPSALQLRAIEDAQDISVTSETRRDILSDRFQAESADIRFRKPAAGSREGAIIELARRVAAVQGRKPHQFGQRVSAGLAPERQAAIAQRPGSTFEPQSLRERAEQHETMSDADVLAGMRNVHRGIPVDSDENFAVLDGLEYMNRLQDRMDSPGVTAEARVLLEEEFDKVLDEMNKIGMNAGQMLRQFAELKRKRPEHLIELMERKAGGKRKLFFTEVQKATLTELVRLDFAARDQLKTAEKTMLATLSETDIQAFKDASEIAMEASDKMARYVAGLTPRTLPDMIRQLHQGGLIVLTSQGINVSSNFTRMMLDDFGQNIVAGADAVINYITKRGRRIDFVPFRARGRGFKRGTKQGVRELRLGAAPGAGIHGEVFARGFHPLQAWKKLGNLITGKEDPGMLVDERGKVPISDRLKLIIDGLAVIPEGQFRLLGFGDHPFRESKYDSVVEEQANIRKLKGREREVFLLAPDPDVRALAMRESVEAVYQERGQVLSKLLEMRKGFRDKGVLQNYMDAILIAPIAPFIVTPVNVANASIRYAYYPLPMFEMLAYSAAAHKAGKAAVAAKSDGARAQHERVQREEQRKALQSMGIAIVGATMTWAAATLVRLGLVKGAPPEDEKERQLAFGDSRPYTVNTSALQRLVTPGGDPRPRPDDIWRNLSVFGFFGVNMLIEANRAQARREEPARTAEGQSRLEQEVISLAKMIPELGAAVTDMTMLRGVYGFLRAVSEKRFGAWVDDYFRSITSIALPNQYASVNRARQVYIPEMKSDVAWSSLKNAIAEKNPFIEWETAYPYKRDPLGRPIVRTPDGAVPWVFNVLDASKAGQAPADPIWKEIGHVYEGSGRNSAAIPGTPSRTFVLSGVKVEMNPREFDRFLELVGRERVSIYDRRTKSPGYTRRDPERKALMLQRFWSAGLERGKVLFYQEQRDADTDFIARFREALKR